MTRLIALLIIFGFQFNTISGQGENSYRKLVDGQYVPKEVRTTFKKMYPNVFFSLWYTSHAVYWYEDYAPGWYGNWYPTRQVMVIKLEKPAYYEVDFQFQGNPTRAIFNRYGQWFEARSRLTVLPPEVESGLRNSEYGDWIRSDHKEQLFIPGHNGAIYRLRVSDRKHSCIIRLNENGGVVQVKYLD